MGDEIKMKKSLVLLMTAVVMASALGGCTSKIAKNEKVKIEFMQYKSEAKGTFDTLIAKFQEENPNIEVVQTQVPDTGTVLKSRVAKGDVPDIVAVGGDTIFKETAKAGVFEDMTGSNEVANVQSAYIKMLKDVSETDKVYAVPFAANANGVIYNKKMFSDLGLTVPKTWDEFVATLDKIKAAGKTPFYLTYKDAWTTLPAYNVLAANTSSDTFFTDRTAGKTTFKEGYKEATDKFLKLVQYGQSDIFGTGYNDGNVAFAKGEAVMYLQGIWAIPEIKKANPDIDLGVFPYPVTNTPEKNRVVSGVDLLLALSSKSEHKEEAKKFIDFLLKDDVAKQYINEQKAFSCLKGITQDDAVFEGFKDSFAKGALVDFPDHYLPSALTTDAKLQSLAKSKDTNAFLTSMDTEWDAIQNRK